MFSQKYKDDVVEDLFQSMKQLDRIEFQNRIIQQNQKINTLKTVQASLIIINFISMSFLIYFSGAFLHLLSLGLYSEIHRQSGLFFFIMFILSSLIFVILFFRLNLLSDRTKKENDEHLEFILNK